MTSLPPVRATDHEREETVEALRAAFAAGCLSASELADRAGRAYAAVTREDLRALLCDLPLGAVQPRNPSPGRPRGTTRRLLGWELGLMLACAGTMLIIAAFHSVVAVPFILLWLVALRLWGWSPRLTRRARGSGKDEI